MTGTIMLLCLTLLAVVCTGYGLIIRSMLRKMLELECSMVSLRMEVLSFEHRMLKEERP